MFSPTRELALQTLKFTRELGRYTGLRAACVLGGESMEKQFAVMHERPDVVRYRVVKIPFLGTKGDFAAKDLGTLLLKNFPLLQRNLVSLQ